MNEQDTHETSRTAGFIDLRIMKDIAEAAAISASEKVATKVRDEMRQEHERLKDEILDAMKSEFKAYHGDMSPSEHLVQHSRMSNFLNWLEKLNQGFWSQLLGAFLKWAMAIFFIGYFIWTQTGGNIPGAN